MPDHSTDLGHDLTKLITAAAEPARRSRRRKRRPGAPLGNQNAFKHGLYSRKATQPQVDALVDARKSSYLTGEIDILRLQIADLVDRPNPNLELLLRAIAVLARVVRIDDRVRFGP